MTKAELIKIAEENKMGWIVEEITNQKLGVYCNVETEIPELDAIVDQDGIHSVAGYREYRPDGMICYTIYCPTDWMDLWGWA